MSPKPPAHAPDRTTLYVLSLVVLIVLVVAAYTAMELVHPGGASAEVVSRISAIVVPAAVALAAVMQASAARQASARNGGRIRELHIAVDGKLQAFVDAAKSAANKAERAARREGYGRGLVVDPADPQSLLAGEQRMDDADAKAVAADAHVPLPDPPAPPHTK